MMPGKPRLDAPVAAAVRPVVFKNARREMRVLIVAPFARV
jgi:hypothetical protein